MSEKQKHSKEISAVQSAGHHRDRIPPAVGKKVRRSLKPFRSDVSHTGCDSPLGRNLNIAQDLVKRTRFFQKPLHLFKAEDAPESDDRSIGPWS